MDYFYQEALRWSFGFENPNKAAVLFAGALPLAWTLWMLAWRLPPGRGRIAALFPAAGLVLSMAFLLFKTYSRGGVVAAACGVGYVIVRGMGALSGWRSLLQACGWRAAADVILIGLVIVVFGCTGLAERTIEPAAKGDASIGNRLILWRAALLMAADNPWGFGAGRSGEVFMNWYQPMERSEGYRTMVNSYLTALVEWGWPSFALAMMIAAFGWGWANPGRPGTGLFELAGGLRGSVLAFAVGGIFSTTMEERILWLLPTLCGAVLVIWSFLTRRPMREAAAAMGSATMIVTIMWIGGQFLREQELAQKNFSQGLNGNEIVKIEPRDSEAAAWLVVPDSEVMGVHYGKLIRGMAQRIEARIEITPAPQAHCCDVLVLAGNAVARNAAYPEKCLVLLAPAVIPLEQAKKVLGSAPHTILFLPEIDEDGRCEFWTQVALGQKNVETFTLEGVGRQIDWSWDQVVNHLQARSAHR